MGLWSKKKVDPLDLNKGYEWTKDEQVAVEELNAMTNCSLYAQDFVEKLVTNIDVSEAGVVGTPSVTLVDGDGATEGKPYKKFKFANLKGEKGDTGGVAPVVQNTGTATGSVMSQNAVTTELESRAKSDASNLTDEDVASWANKFFPVGSIYMSVDSTSPASIFGGTWEQILGKFLLASDDVITDGTITTAGSYHTGDNGGSADAVVVSHNHGYKAVTTLNTSHTHNNFANHQIAVAPDNVYWEGTYANGINPTGVDGTGKNMPPYFVVYMWKRVA